MIEQPDLDEAVREPDATAFDLEFPQPVVRDAGLSTRFLELHRTLERPASTLERQGLLVSWLQDVALRSPASPRRQAARRAARLDPAVLRACELLRDDPVRNVSLQELADAAGVSRFRLVRLFRSAFGVAPHGFQIAQRVKAARRHLEAGRRPAAAAALAGFHDQSHLNRHFGRTLGLTPAQYARLVRPAR